MAAPMHRRAFTRAVVLSIGALAMMSAAGCSAQARAERGLKEVVHREIRQFNKYHQRKVKPNVYQTIGGFYKVFKERVKPVISMRQTNSPRTPFVATLAFTEDTYLTQIHPGSVDAQRDAHFSLSTSKESEVVYTYVGGMWRKKEIY